MVGMILCPFLCKQCGMFIQIPLHTLRQPFEYLDDPPRGVSPVAIVCSHCKTVASYTAEDMQRAEVALSPNHNWAVLDKWQRCEEGACERRLPLFVERSAATSEEALDGDIKTWTWGEVYCPDGHPIAKPDWIGSSEV
jgi:hypothetical protein